MMTPGHTQNLFRAWRCGLSRALLPNHVHVGTLTPSVTEFGDVACEEVIEVK